MFSFIALVYIVGMVFVLEVHNLSGTVRDCSIVIGNGSIKIPNTNKFQIKGSVNISIAVESKMY